MLLAVLRPRGRDCREARGNVPSARSKLTIKDDNIPFAS